MNSHLRSSLAPRREITTAGLIGRVLQDADVARLRALEENLLTGINQGSLGDLGTRTLKRVRRALAKRQLADAFASPSARSTV